MARADPISHDVAAARPCAGERGFTLLELLVALTLLGLIMAVLFGELRFAARAWDAADSKAERAGELLSVHNFVRQRLQQIQLPTRRDEPGSDVRLFDGSSHSLTFVGVMPAAVSAGGFYEISMSVVPGEEHQDLLVTWLPFDDDAAAAVSPGPDNSRVVLRGVQELRFSYFGRSGDDTGAQWWDAWPSRDTVPMLVRIEAAFPDGDPRVWPDLVVTPAIAGAPMQSP